MPDLVDYTVLDGDCLSSIAAKGKEEYTFLLSLGDNPHHFQNRNPNQLMLGEKVKVPAEWVQKKPGATSQVNTAQIKPMKVFLRLALVDRTDKALAPSKMTLDSGIVSMKDPGKGLIEAEVDAGLTASNLSVELAQAGTPLPSVGPPAPFTGKGGPDAASSDGSSTATTLGEVGGGILGAAAGGIAAYEIAKASHASTAETVVAVAGGAIVGAVLGGLAGEEIGSAASSKKPDKEGGPAYPAQFKHEDFKDSAKDAVADNRLLWSLKIGSLPPCNSPSGTQERLNNLGFTGDKTTTAVSAYQRHYKLSVSGNIADIGADICTRHDTL